LKNFFFISNVTHRSKSVVCFPSWKKKKKSLSEKKIPIRRWLFVDWLFVDSLALCRLFGSF